MNSKLFMVIRILLGLMLVVFGANKFLDFIPPLELSEAGQQYFQSLITTKTMALVGVVEIVSGLAFIFNKYGALMAIISMSVAINAVLFHIALANDTIAPAVVFLALNILTLIGYRDRYKQLLAS